MGWLVVVAQAVSRKTPIYFILVDSLGEDSVYDRVDVVLVVARSVVGVLLDLVLLLHLVPAGYSVGGEDFNGASC